MGLIPNFGPSAAQIRAAGGRMDPSGNVVWPLQRFSTTTGGSSAISRLTAFSDPFRSSIGDGSRTSGFSRSATQEANQLNLGNAPAMGRMASGMALDAASVLDPFASDRFYQNLEKAFPGYRDTFSQMTANTQAMLQGRIPDDVADMVRMISAEYGVQGGHEATARNLGLTSLDMATQGFQQGGQLFGIADQYLTPDQYDVFAATDQIRSQLLAAGLVTPGQVGQMELELRRQDTTKQLEMERLNLERRRLDMAQSQWQAEMSWNRELSNLNREWEQMIYDTQQQLYNDAAAARSAEQTSLLDAFQNVSSILQADQPRTRPLTLEGEWEEGPSYPTYSRVPNAQGTGFSGVPSGPGY